MVLFVNLIKEMVSWF